MKPAKGFHWQPEIEKLVLSARAISHSFAPLTCWRLRRQAWSLRFGRPECEKPLQKALGGRCLLWIPGLGYDRLPGTDCVSHSLDRVQRLSLEALKEFKLLPGEKDTVLGRSRWRPRRRGRCCLSRDSWLLSQDERPKLGTGLLDYERAHQRGLISPPAQPATASAIVSRLTAVRAMKGTTGVKPSAKCFE